MSLVTTYYPSTTMANVTTNNSMWYSANRYFYQLVCPAKNCKALNWAELDTIVSCKNCGSNLKAVNKKADFEIEVGQ